MDFLFSDDQTEMRDSVARIFQDLCDDAQIKKLNSQPNFFHQALWQQLGETGIFGLPFAEQDGGLGLSLVDLCTIIELQGESVAPIPLISSIVEVGMTIASSDAEQLRQQILPRCIAGEIFSPVRPYSGVMSAAPLRAAAEADSVVLNGRSGFVPYADLAKGYLIEVAENNGDSLLVYCDAGIKGIEVVEQIALNDEPAGYLIFKNVELSKSDIVARKQQAINLIALQQQRTQVALGALQVGCLEKGLKRTAEYVSDRKQFGRALGSFQAVSQQAADAFMEIESLRSVYWRALDQIEQGESLQLSAPVVKYWVAQAGHKAAHIEMHLHGGIGQDLDYPIHRYFLFAKQAERYAGSPSAVSEQLGASLMNMTQVELESQCL